MSSKFRQGDIVHIEAVIEIDSNDSVGIIVKSHNGAETRVRVDKATIKFSEPGPLKSGDTVTKTLKGKKVEGVVEHRSGDMAWVRFGDAHLVEPVSNLSRL